MDRVHPACAAFRDIDGEEFEELRASLMKIGQQQPCWKYKGQLIDGKNRERALLANGQGVHYEEWTPVSTDPQRIEEEIKLFCLAQNFARRHSTSTERAMTIAKLYPNGAKHGGDRKSDQVSPDCLDPAREISAKLKVHPETLRQARTVVNGSPDVAKAVSEKKISLKKGAKAAKKKAKPEPASTPFDEPLAGLEWVLSQAVPRVQEHAILIERTLGKQAGAFSGKRIAGLMKQVHDQFQNVQGVLNHARKKFLAKEKK